MIDTQVLIRELVPLSVSALQKNLNLSQTHFSQISLLNSNNQFSSQMTKRIRTYSSGEESQSSQTSRKKKKDWPKGKSRKTPAENLLPPETPSPQEPEKL
ncbi:hypothetical protein JTB14_035191 [Gonioctena quinquepunctata]|nr:hypothetical protein JTB14_035191 [Gonioctena quinquepunctata]